MERNWSTAAAVMANPTEAREEIHALRAEAERLREALKYMVAYCKVAPIYPGKDGGKMQENGYAAFAKARAALRAAE